MPEIINTTPDEVKTEEAVIEKKEEEKVETDKGFIEEEFVSKNKHNQALRKLREMELEKIELARQVVATTPQPAVRPAPVKPATPPEDEDIWGEKKEEPVIAPAVDEQLVERLVEEKIKPIYDAQKAEFDKQKRNDRAAFFEKNPKYLNDANHWQELIEEMNRSINPASGDSYFEQLEKARILLEHADAVNAPVENFKKEIVADASNVATSAPKKGKEGELTPEDRTIMKNFGVSEEGMKAYKRKVKDGDMLILGMK